MIAVLSFGAIAAVMTVIVTCRLLARAIREVNTWDRRSR